MGKRHCVIRCRTWDYWYPVMWWRQRFDLLLAVRSHLFQTACITWNHISRWQQSRDVFWLSQHVTTSNSSRRHMPFMKQHCGSLVKLKATYFSDLSWDAERERETNLAKREVCTILSMPNSQTVMKYIRGCIRKFSDWVDNEIYAYNNKYSLRSNTNGNGGKTH
jgi:hypothetical protein